MLELGHAECKLEAHPKKPSRFYISERLADHARLRTGFSRGAGHLLPVGLEGFFLEVDFVGTEQCAL